MKKQLVVSILSLALANSMNASQNVGGEHCFRAAFHKKLKRVSSVKRGSFRSLSLNRKANKKEVFIDWRQLYWGKLSDLVYSEEETYTDEVQGIAGTTEEQNMVTLDTADALVFATELRQELKSFARQYNLKIVWRKKSLDVTDGTAAFLEYWDKGYSQGDRDKVMPFEELCVLNVKKVTAKASNTKGENTQHLPSGTDSPMYIFLKSLLLRKEA